MAKKQAIAKETAAATASATPARAAKPRAPRVKVAQHSKNVPAEPSAASPVAAGVEYAAGNTEAAISRIAYGYWESRGCQGGSALEDWVRAETEYHQRTTEALV